jgi:hypothetical protein
MSLAVVVALLLGGVLGGCGEKPVAGTATVATATATQTAATPEPVSEPIDLGQVSAPPEATVAMIDPKSADSGSEYSIVFVPYGEGPGAGGSRSGLVISISTSTPDSGVKKPYDFNGRNALVDVSRLPADQAVKQGGTYEGKLVLVERDGLLSPQLTSVGAKR